MAHVSPSVSLEIVKLFVIITSGFSLCIFFSFALLAFKTQALGMLEEDEDVDGEEEDTREVEEVAEEEEAAVEN